MAGHSNEYTIQHGKILTKPFWILAALTVIGFYFIGVRMIHGIGAVSNLSDGWPWGIWIAYDVATGTALACGGYAVAILVYIMNRMHYHPLIRSAVLTSLFGYMLAGISVIIDLGRWWNAYGFFVPDRWQVNSVMFEVALCVMAYNLVLFIELMPAILERLQKSRWERVRKMTAAVAPKLDKALIFIIVLGITLPSMHQSSLGSLFLIAHTKLHPLWHTGFLPLLFLINCIYIGYGIVMFESIASSYSFKRPYETRHLAGLARILPYISAAWLGIRIYDIGSRGLFEAAFRFDTYSIAFLAEIGLIVAGTVMMMKQEWRRSPRNLFISAILLCLGGALYRMNVYLIGFNPGEDWITYFPAVGEFMITVGLVSLEIMGYLVLVKLFPIMPNAEHHEAAH